VAVIPRCGHVPVDTETKQRVRFENLILNWLDENGLVPGRAPGHRGPMLRRSSAP
jgi:hypothetical protein